MESKARDIATHPNGSLAHSRDVSASLSLSTSPVATFLVNSSSFRGQPRRSSTGVKGTAKQLKPFATEDIKILLLENVNQTGRDSLEKQGYQVDFYKSSLSEDDLIAKIRLSSLPAPSILCLSRD